MTTLGDILVLGLGKSGLATAAYCARRLGSDVRSVTAIDTADTPALRESAEALRSLGCRVQLGARELHGAYDLCIASPGIPPHAPIMRAAVAAARETVSEIEFAFRRSSSSWVAITGTNGKTTTTALVTHILGSGGVPARAVGNIGVAAIEVVEEIERTSTEVVLVAEVSSFQLALTRTFHPRVALLLNVTPDHVDWHGSVEAYASDKARIFSNLAAGDTAIIDIDDAGSRALTGAAGAGGAKVVQVSAAGSHSAQARAIQAVLHVPGYRGEDLALCTVEDLAIKGTHNVSNALAAAAAAAAWGLDRDALRTGLMTFHPIEHRLEPVGSYGGVAWFNDSKATNPDAVLKALSAFGDTPLIVLLGGRNKGNSFDELARAAALRAKAVVVFGEAASEIAASFDGLEIAVCVVATMAEAVEHARVVAAPGDAVVLSPACASFDEFTSYEHRGRVFKELVSGRPSGETL